MRHIRAGIGVLILMSIASQASGDYWISVGSFREVATAEGAAEAMSRRVGASLVVARYEAGSGTVYRIVMGPFGDIARARETLAGIRRDAVPDAWIVDDAPLVSSTVQPSLPETRSTELDLDALLRSIREPLPQPEPYESSSVYVSSELPAEPVTEIPPGYQLNRLRRK